jgi:hypothetical protein
MSFWDEVGDHVDRDLDVEAKTPTTKRRADESMALSTCCASCDSRIAGIHRGDCPKLEELIV